MSKHVTLSGTVRDLFAHRFSVSTDGGVVLADLGPEGVKAIALSPGDAVTLEGDRKPSELKVSRVTRGTDVVEITHPDKHTPGHDAARHVADAGVARAAAVRAGLEPLGQPRRKPKHFEVLTRDAEGGHHELHVAFDGTVRKRKPVHAGDEKWAGQFGTA